jgi:hypothetical protein
METCGRNCTSFIWHVDKVLGPVVYGQRSGTSVLSLRPKDLSHMITTKYCVNTTKESIPKPET